MDTAPVALRIYLFICSGKNLSVWGMARRGLDKVQFVV
jgi:hypothetical protein